MTGNKTERSFTRFIPPVIIIAIGLIIMKFPSILGDLFAGVSFTIGFGGFTIGALSMVIIINQSRNHLIENEELFDIAQVLIVYGGLITVTMHENIIPVNVAILSVCGILLVGSMSAILIDTAKLAKEDVKIV